MPHFHSVTIVAAHHSKANKEAGLVKRKVCFILDPGNGWKADACPKAYPPSPLPHWQPMGKSFYRLRNGVTCRHSTVALTFTLKLVISGLTGIIFIVLSTMNLQFQDWLVSISLSFWNCGSFISWLRSGLHVVNFYHLVEDSVSIRLNMAQNIIRGPWGMGEQTMGGPFSAVSLLGEESQWLIALDNRDSGWGCRDLGHLPSSG